VLQRLVALDVTAGLQAVHAGHAPVHEHHVVRFDGILPLDRGDGFLPGGDRVHAERDPAQGFLEDFPRGGIVVDDEHPEFPEPLGQDPARARRGADSEPDGEEERAAGPGNALEPDAAAHEVHEAAADGEAEPGAAVLAGGGHVGLREGLEELRRLFGRHADARVAHGELELHLVARALEQLDVEPDLAALGELDGVVDEVGEDLAEAQRVAEQVFRKAGRDVREELEALLVRLLRGERDDGADDLVELEADLPFMVQ
jgi:hypothetical protein